MHVATKATRIAALAALIAGLGASAVAQAQSLPSTGVRAVPTYEAVGLYWTAPGANAAGCDVRYRKAGSTSWSTGLNLWYDALSNECRGSLVNLTPGTNYETQVGIAGNFTRGINFATWTNFHPVAKTVKVASGSAALNITEGGSASGYVVYDGAGATLDAANGPANNITVNASYVIVRNFKLRGAREHAILINPNVHDVVIEDNDISGWGRTRDGKWGADMDSAVRAICSSETLTRVTVQRNRMYNPRYPSNSWANGHPAGPQAISFSYCAGNHVFRWNEVYSTNGNRFNDAFGGEDNFTTTGFPNSDTDIYGNRISHAWDDAIEAEGANKNVRIWGNYMDRTALGVATTVTSVGPVYIFRNVWNRSQFYEGKSNDSDAHETFLKSGSHPDFRNGRRYVFHNTMLQAMDAGNAYGGGGGAGLGGTGEGPFRNTVSMNNIYHLWKANSAVYGVGSDNTFQADMYNGAMGTAVTSGVNATPQYAAGHGWVSEAGGLYALAAGTPGHDAGVRIANFNDGYSGAGPDIGAAEAGLAAMKFGVAASTGTSGGTVTPPPTAPTPPPTTPTPPPTTPTVPPSTGGTAYASLSLNASAWSISGGQSVTFTATVSGNAGVPTGTMAFRTNGNTIANCGAAAVVNGTATCTTSALVSGANAITGVYSGNGTYATGQAGPITINVSGTVPTPPPSAPTPPPTTPTPPPTAPTGPLPTSFGMDATAYTFNAGQSVSFSAKIPGHGGTARFQYDGNVIGNCSAVPVVNGAAVCATTSVPQGTWALRAYYSGSGSYPSGTAGPITITVKGASSGTVPVSSPLNVQGLWWGSQSESGWGVNLAHQGDIVFATWFTYDANGRGQWLVMSRGDKVGPNAFSGALYRTTGPGYNEASFDPARVGSTQVGSATLTFSDANNGVFTATVDGATVTKAITRQVFDTLPSCTAGGAYAANYQDLWWRSGGTESGWGMNITHQGNTMFITWFTYDADGKGLWLVASNVYRNGDGSYSGKLYRTTGPAFNAAAWNPAAVGATEVGTVHLAFSDAANGTFTSNVNGISRAKPITRQHFANPATVCR